MVGKPKIEIDKADIARIQGDMQKLLAANLNPSDVMRSISVRMRGMQVEHFQRQEDIEGKPWPELKKRTIQARMRRGHGSPGNIQILRDWGILFNSINQKHGRDFAATGTNLIYAPTHQLGDEKRNIPQRQFIYLKRVEVDELRAFLNSKLIEKPLGIR